MKSRSVSSTMVLAITLGGCVSVNDFQADRDKRTSAGLAQIEGRITPQHLAECRTLIEKPVTLNFGTVISHKVTGPLTLSRPLTCLTMGSSWTGAVQTVAVYHAPTKYTRDGKVIESQGACEFRLQDGKVTVGLGQWAFQRPSGGLEPTACNAKKLF
jgi:hypothetical protein